MTTVNHRINEDNDYKRVRTRDLNIGDVVAYPYGNTSVVLASARIRWRWHVLIIRPDGGKSSLTFFTRRNLVWWVRKG